MSYPLHFVLENNNLVLFRDNIQGLLKCRDRVIVDCFQASCAGLGLNASFFACSSTLKPSRCIGYRSLISAASPAELKKRCLDFLAVLSDILQLRDPNEDLANSL